MANDLVTRMSLDDSNFSSGISSAIGSLNKLDKQATLTSRGLDNFFKGKGVDEMKSQFTGVEKILNSLERKMGSTGTGMKQQLKAMTVAASELEQTYRKLSDAEKQSGAGQELRNHIDQLIAKSGELKDTMTDVQGAIKFAASDTAQLDAFAQGLTALSAGAQVATGALSLFGVSEQKAAAIQKTIVSLIGITNGLQTIQNALQKESNLMQFIRIAREKGLAVALGLRTAATTAATAAEEAETVAVEANTAAWAMNPIGAIVIGILAAITAVVALTNAFSDNTDEIDKNSEKIKEHEEQVKKDSEAQQSWAKDVARACSDQLSTYRMLQDKWKECNGDVKLQGKFMRDYKSEIDSLGLGIKNLLDAERAFVTYTDSVVAAIYARARAEAYENKIKESAEREVELMAQNYKDNKYGWNFAKDKEKIWAEEANKIGLGQGDYTYHNIHTGEYSLTPSGKNKVNSYRQQQAYEKWAQRHNERVAKIYAEREEQALIRELQKRETEIVDRELKKAGLSGKSYSSATSGGARGVYGNYGNHHGGGSRGTSSRGGSGKGGSGKGTTKKPDEPSDEEILRGLEEKILDMNQNLKLDLVPEGEIDAYIKQLATLQVEYNELAEKLGAPLIGSLDWKKKELSDLQKQITSGYIDEKDLDKAKALVEQKKKEIEEDEIALGIKTKPLEGTLDWFENEINKRQEKLRNKLLPEEEIEKTKKEIEDLVKDEYELKIKLGFEEAPRTDFEKNTVAGKYKDDWEKLGKFIGDYNKKWDEYQQNLKQYEQDMNAYNAAQKKYEEDNEKYLKNQKLWNKYLKIRNDLQQKYIKIYGDAYDEETGEYAYEKSGEYNTELQERINKLLRSTQQESDKSADSNEQLAAATKKVREEYDILYKQLKEQKDSGLISDDDYERQLSSLNTKLQDAINEIQSNLSIDLSEVVNTSIGKPIEPKFDLQLPKKPFAPGQEIDLKAIFGDSLDRVPAHIQELMNAVSQKMSENISDGERVIGSKILVALQNYLDEVSQGKLVFKPIIEPQYKEEGSADWLRTNYENALQQAQRLQHDYEIGLINYDKAKSDLDKINEMLEKLHLKPITLEIKSELFEQLDYGAETLKNFGSAISQLGNATKNEALNAAGVIAEAIANIWLGYSKATLQAASMGPWAWVGFSVGALAQVIGVIASLKSNSFAGGGLVPGSSWSGDKVYARVNSGEMILNKKQQSNLFRMLDGGHSAASSGNVEFKLKGQELVGCIKNYNDKKSKLR